MKRKTPVLDSVAAPMKLDFAQERWSRERITHFAVPQPPTPKHHLVGRCRPECYMVDATGPGTPSTGDITVVPAGQRKHIPPSLVDFEASPKMAHLIDNRRILNDTTYPWRCTGRVLTASGQCTGALVGPRHLLTVSHIVDWNETKGGIGWLKFQPAYFEGEVFPAAFAIDIYSYERITAASIDDFEVASDYVVCVLDREIGNELGWYGAKAYDPNWDDYVYWSHVGYPNDIGGGGRPYFEGPVKVKNSWRPGFLEKGYGRNILIHASTSTGDSGGPFFGWWDDGPSIVGVVCAAGALNPVISHPLKRYGNWVGGGEPLPSLIEQARTELP